MKTYRSLKGPFLERPYFEQDEIESLCQEELSKVALLPLNPEPIRIERFIEKRFGITPLYEELPQGVLGFTRFTTKGVESVVISRSLSDEENKTAARRINTTLAHEAGHCLLHTQLFVLGSQPERLFGDEYDANAPKILCRDEATNRTQRPRYDGRWWEFQANQTIGALLLPKGLVEKALAVSILEPVGSFGLLQIKSAMRQKAADVLSKTFDVNPAVAKIRLDQLFPESQSAQMSL